jgi:hypothetical protein
MSVALCFAVTSPAQTQVPGTGSSATQQDLVNQLLDRITAREAVFLASIQARTPLIETYIQESPETVAGESRPTKDHYFLGRFRIADGLSYEPLVERTDTPPPQKSGWGLLRPGATNKAQGLTFLPRGFAQMAVIDLHDFNRQTYHFEYVRREFLGEVRCLVFDVVPVDRGHAGKFVGRIWVEDRTDSIVRFNGTYVQAPPKGAAQERYFHFDSWRLNIGDGVWVPAQIYVEEAGEDAPAPQVKTKNARPPVAVDAPLNATSSPALNPASNPARGAAFTPRFKAQSRIWDYAATPTSKLDELTSILVDLQGDVKDQDAARDSSPLESQRSWEKQAEDNLLARLEKGGFLAPPGAVDDVLNTVINNLIVSSNLNIDAKARVLLTTPIETFSIGHTIVISRGLVDVLPDEASLALVLADELSHIALGHRTQTQFAFNNQTMLSDADLLQKFRFQRTPDEMLEAGRKTIEIMKASPYQNTANAGLFLKALAVRGALLPRLLQSNLGNQVAHSDSLIRLARFAESAPALEENKLEQIAALPLGSRIKLSPWDNKITLVKTRPISLLSAREKMPFEITPFVLYLTRQEVAAREAGSGGSSASSPAKLSAPQSSGVLRTEDQAGDKDNQRGERSEGKADEKTDRDKSGPKQQPPRDGIHLKADAAQTN